MANKILRLATRSFDTDCAHQLLALGGPRLPRPLAYVIAYVIACITRAAFKFLAGLEAWHRSLFKAVFENECLANPAGLTMLFLMDGTRLLSVPIFF